MTIFLSILFTLLNLLAIIGMIGDTTTNKEIFYKLVKVGFCVYVLELSFLLFLMFYIIFNQ